MGDGSVLMQSATSGQSYFYVYNNVGSSVTAITHNPHEIIFNHPVQALATMVFIHAATKDNIDVSVFLRQINLLNDLYIQDKQESGHFIKYNITGTVVQNQATFGFPVVMANSGGIGYFSFGDNVNVLVSFFSNLTEVDTRLSAIENKTQNQTVSGLNTTFTTGTSVICETLQASIIKTSDINTTALNGTMSIGNSTTGVVIYI